MPTSKSSTHTHNIKFVPWQWGKGCSQPPKGETQQGYLEGVSHLKGVSGTANMPSSVLTLTNTSILLQTSEFGIIYFEFVIKILNNASSFFFFIFVS